MDRRESKSFLLFVDLDYGCFDYNPYLVTGIWVVESCNLDKRFWLVDSIELLLSPKKGMKGKKKQITIVSTVGISPKVFYRKKNNCNSREWVELAFWMAMFACLISRTFSLTINHRTVLARLFSGANRTASVSVTQPSSKLERARIDRVCPPVPWIT